MSELSLYTIRLPVNDYAVAYVGVTSLVPPRRRLKKHLGDHRKSSIGSAIRQCGLGDVRFDVIEVGDRDRIYQREVELISAFGTRQNGYNVAQGGPSARNAVNLLPSTRSKLSAAGKRVSPAGRRAVTTAAQAARLGSRHSEEARAKMSAATCGERHPNFGKALSEATRAKIATAILGKKHTPESIAKMSAVHTGRGHTAETKAKLSAIFSGRKRSPESVAKTAAANRGRRASPEAIAKMSAAKAGKPWSPARRRAEQAKKESKS